MSDSPEHVRLSRGRDTWGPLYTGIYRGHAISLQKSETHGGWHVWIKEPNGHEQHGDGYPTRERALHAAVAGINHSLEAGA